MIQFFKNIWNAQRNAHEIDSLNLSLDELSMELGRLRAKSFKARIALKVLAKTNGRSGTAQKVRRIALAALEELK